MAWAGLFLIILDAGRRTYLGPDCGSGLVRGGRGDGDRVIEDGNRRAEL